MTEALDKIMAGLEDARTYVNGDRAGFAVHEIEVPRPDVAAIRSKTGLSQPAFCPVHRRSRWLRSRTGSRAAGARRGRRACCSR